MNLIIYLIIIFFVSCWVWRKREKFELNTKGLHKQLLFKLAVIFPFLSSIYFILWFGAPYPFKFDADGYNAFLEINKFPLGILALSPILGAFVVYAHRSLQTFTQINATNKQIETATEQLKEAQNKNKVDIYYTEKKFKLEQLSKLHFRDKEININAHLLYSRLYSTIEPYHDDLNYENVGVLNKMLSMLNESMVLILNIDINDFMMNPNCELDVATDKDTNDFINTIMKIQEINLTNKLTSIYNEIIDFIYVYEREIISRIYNNRYEAKGDISFQSITSIYKDTIDNFEENQLYNMVIDDVFREINQLILLIYEIIHILSPTLNLKDKLSNLECCVNTIKNRNDSTELHFSQYVN